MSIQSILTQKERLPRDLLSSLVYSFSFDACSANCIGQTKRCLRARVAEHLGFSCRTGVLLARPVQSAIREHADGCYSIQQGCSQLQVF